ncbi:DUF3592 domain-containing protein [Pseudoduganella namucuonensis]|uniref:DUF3592 domain-containing protein n=1 Tax=Pseudoduganella namucuonensis TaxID=1035707 RepID=A0A1I7KW81_9BURK|nr:DUF3592 domain-containing protein [Pseudoduganella namucuonensis]SFV01752.1 Protein of unknown function [Pseudoduganella namucuonensis]
MVWLIMFVPFLLIGVFLLGLAALKIAQHLDAQSWQPVRATLLERGIAVEQNAGGGDRPGGASRVSGAFSYQWQGKRYESSRLSFFTAKTRAMGYAPDDWDARLDAIVGEPGGAFTAWVNPLDPAEAVALRDLRWLEVGAMVGFGLLLVWLCSALLFGGDPHQAAAGFSWGTVGVMWIVGLLLGVLCPLLWRDGHPVWAALTALPLMLAVYGTGHGLLLLFRGAP